MSKHFRWNEFLLLRQLDIYVFPNTRQYLNLLLLAKKAEAVRTILGAPMHVTSCLRPGFYNTMVRGSSLSEHRNGAALDFKPVGVHADEGRKRLAPYLEKLEIRMERPPDDERHNWIHIDLKNPGKKGNRYFKPF